MSSCEFFAAGGAGSGGGAGIGAGAAAAGRGGGAAGFGAAGAGAGLGASAALAALDASSSAMMRRMEARISSIDGSVALAACCDIHVLLAPSPGCDTAYDPCARDAQTLARRAGTRI